MNLQPAEIAAAWNIEDGQADVVCWQVLGEVRQVGKTLTAPEQKGPLGAPTFKV